MTRQQILADLRSGKAQFDVVVIGGGITGAGAAREAAGSGLKTLLVEQRISPGAPPAAPPKWSTVVCAISAVATLG